MTAVAEVQAEQATVDSTRALAALRVLTGAAGLLVLFLLKPWDFAGLGLERRGVVGAELVDLFPSSRGALLAGSVVFVGVLVALTVGWRTRLMGWSALLLGFWLYGMSQGISGTTHIHHMLLLFAILGAASDPGWAMVLARLGVGLIYFFPGLAKLLVLGEWPGFLEQHIVNAQAQYAPVDLLPPGWMVALMAYAAVVFELSFVALVFTRWRRHAVVAALGFHLSTGLLMGVWFQGLVVVLPALLFPMPEPRGDLPRSLVPAGVLIAGMVAFGVMGENRAWPVASYPKFDHAPGGIEVEVAIATTADGDRYRVGQVLLPHHASGFWAKVEHNHEPADLERAIEARLGEPVTVTWEQAVG